MIDVSPPQPAGTPNAPGIGAVQPTAEERAAIEGQWAALRDAPKALARLILLINEHPELIDWAKASEAGTVRL
jgi:hypothetical protein